MKFTKNTDNRKKDMSKPAIAFYVLAIVFLIYGAYMIYTVYDYLGSYYANYDMGIWDDVANTLQYFVSNSSSYFVYAVLCYGIGMILQMLHGLNKRFAINEEVEVNDSEEVVEEATVEFNTEEQTV